MPDETPIVTIKTDERTFKTLADQILHMKVISEASRIERMALVNSAKSFIDAQIKNHQDGYRPLEFFMNESEIYKGRPKVYTIKRWLNHNLNVFESKGSRGMPY